MSEDIFQIQLYAVFNRHTYMRIQNLKKKREKIHNVNSSQKNTGIIQNNIKQNRKRKLS